MVKLSELPGKDTEMVPAEIRTLDRVKGAGWKFAGAVKEGLAISGSQKATGAVLSLVKRTLGDRYPAFFSTPYGRQVEPFVVPALLLFGTEVLPEGRVPHREKVQAVLERAVVGAAKDGGDRLFAELEEIYLLLARSDLVALANVADEPEDELEGEAEEMPEYRYRKGKSVQEDAEENTPKQTSGTSRKKSAQK